MIQVPILLRLRYFPRRILLSSKAIGRLLYFKPQYSLLAVLVSVLFYELIFWLLNIGLVQYLLLSPFITFGEKLSVIVGSYTAVFLPPYSGLSITLFLVSVLQGINVAGLVYLVRYDRKMTKESMMKNISGAGGAGVLSALGLGCAACGTSLITPIITFFFSSSSVALSEAIGYYAALAALVIAIVTVYLTGTRLMMKS